MLEELDKLVPSLFVGLPDWRGDNTDDIDVMFLDLTMPELDGVGVLEALKQENINCAVFVISADVQPEMQNKVLNLGAKAFLRKPVNGDILLENLTMHGFL